MADVGLTGRGIEMSDDSRTADAVVSAYHPHRLRFVAALFMGCWAMALAVALSVDREGFGLLAVAGAFGAAVFPWIAGVTGYLLSGRAGRWVGPAVSVAVFLTLGLAEHL
jgi:hypothetical protein